MMLQFAIAGLLTSAQIIVSERKSRSLQRLLTTATRRSHILSGITWRSSSSLLPVHHPDRLWPDCSEGELLARQPGATLLVAFTAALCIAALGLLIGAVPGARSRRSSFRWFRCSSLPG